MKEVGSRIVQDLVSKTLEKIERAGSWTPESVISLRTGGDK